MFVNCTAKGKSCRFRAHCPSLHASAYPVHALALRAYVLHNSRNSATKTAAPIRCRYTSDGQLCRSSHEAQLTQLMREILQKVQDSHVRVFIPS